MFNSVLDQLDMLIKVIWDEHMPEREACELLLKTLELKTNVIVESKFNEH